MYAIQHILTKRLLRDKLPAMAVGHFIEVGDITTHKINPLFCTGSVRLFANLEDVNRLTIALNRYSWHYASKIMFKVHEVKENPNISITKEG